MLIKTQMILSKNQLEILNTLYFDEIPSANDERDLRDKLNSFLNDREEFNPVSNLEETLPSLTTAKN